MKVLVACEYSGIVRDAFWAEGHTAWSCDFLKTERPDWVLEDPIFNHRTGQMEGTRRHLPDRGYHHKGDVLEILDYGWDLMIAHPPCTYLCSSGLHWNKRIPGREEKTEEALEFVRALMNAPIPHICIENPIGRIGTAIRKADQIIQPYEFGHDASKRTALWLKNLPLLEPTGYIPPRMVKGKPRWGNQTDSGQNRLPPSEDRWKLRSTTYEGIAKAMAKQWGRYVSERSAA